MKRNIINNKTKKGLLVSLIFATLLAGCGAPAQNDVKDETGSESVTESSEDTTDSGEVENTENESEDSNKMSVSKLSDVKDVCGDWEMVYSEYRSKYGIQETEYDYVTMCDDEYGITSVMKISEKEGKYIADYKCQMYESDRRYFGNELKVEEGSAYTDCENSSWYLTFTDPFGNEDDYSMNNRFTLIDDKTLVGAVLYESGKKGTEDYYSSVELSFYYRADDPRLKDKENLRYFETVKVSDTVSLLNSLKNNTKVVLTSGKYDLSTVDESQI
ncbi:MAG: hypothetical protein K6F84_03280, partial [Lachnospiraceae bacterium]|nr:hypothetical protein [Lachnospiraceae bacterium]